jgi:hypothetical protein
MDSPIAPPDTPSTVFPNFSSLAADGSSDDDSDWTSYSLFGPSAHHAQAKSERHQLKQQKHIDLAAPSSSPQRVLPATMAEQSTKASQPPSTPIRDKRKMLTELQAHPSSPTTPARSTTEEIQSYVEMIMTSARKAERKLRSTVLQSERRLEKIKELEEKLRQVTDENNRYAPLDQDPYTCELTNHSN